MTYHQPRSREEAAALLAADPSARVLAGGTDLIVQMRSGRIAPGAVIDIKRISAMQAVQGHDGGFTIGAAMPCTGLKQAKDLAAAWPGVVEAANLIGSVQVRNRATMAGTLCTAPPAAEAVRALLAAGAPALVAGRKGGRWGRVEEIPAAPGKTSLAAGEFIAELHLPPRPKGGGDAYLRATPRTEMDIAIVGVGVALVIGADGVCTSARVALGAVAPTAILVPEAGAALVGTKVDDNALDAMEAAARAACRPIGDKRGSAEYRTHMAGILAGRAATIALGRARGEPA